MADPARWTLTLVLVLALPASYYWVFSRQNREPTGKQAIAFLAACFLVVAAIFGQIALDHANTPQRTGSPASTDGRTMTSGGQARIGGAQGVVLPGE